VTIAEHIAMLARMEAARRQTQAHLRLIERQIAARAERLMPRQITRLPEVQVDMEPCRRAALSGHAIGADLFPSPRGRRAVTQARPPGCGDRCFLSPPRSLGGRSGAGYGGPPRGLIPSLRISTRESSCPDLRSGGRPCPGSCGGAVRVAGNIRVEPCGGCPTVLPSEAD